eukprot:1147899-Pelagomonas_calceolata.AAC.6
MGTDTRTKRLMQLASYVFVLKALTECWAVAFLAVVASVSGWARSMTYDRSQEVGDTGTYFVSDESNAVTRIVPNIMSTHDNDAA